MSVQGCLIKIFGYKFNYDDLLFSFIEDEEEEYDFVDVIGMDTGYYDLQKLGSSKNALLKILIDGMNGEYKYVGFITEASYIMNTHYDDYWRHTYKNDDYLKKYAQKKIETLLRRKLGEPKEFVVEHYS